MERYPSYIIEDKGIFLTIMAGIININSKSASNVYCWFDNQHIPKIINDDNKDTNTNISNHDNSNNNNNNNNENNNKNNNTNNNKVNNELYESFWGIQKVLCDPESIVKSEDSDKRLKLFQKQLSFVLKQFRDNPVSVDEAQGHLKVWYFFFLIFFFLFYIFINVFMYVLCFINL